MINALYILILKKVSSKTAANETPEPRAKYEDFSDEAADGFPTSPPPMVLADVPGSPGKQSGDPSMQKSLDPAVWPAKATAGNGAGAACLSELLGETAVRIQTQAAASNTLFMNRPSSQMALRATATAARITSDPIIVDRLFRRLAAQVDVREAGSWLAETARRAYLLRRSGIVEWACQSILDLPLSSRVQSIAAYYSPRHREFAPQKMRPILTEVVDEAPAGYRERVILELAANYRRCGELEASHSCCLEAVRASAHIDELTGAQAHTLLAVLRAMNGDHRGALADLQRLWPLIHCLSRAYPVLYYDYLNSLAVELGEVGRIAEARAAISIPLSSSLAPVYPNWAETQREIEVAAARPQAHTVVLAIGLPKPPVATSTKHRPRVAPRKAALIHLRRPAGQLLLAGYILTKPIVGQPGNLPIVGQVSNLYPACSPIILFRYVKRARIRDGP